MLFKIDKDVSSQVYWYIAKAECNKKDSIRLIGGELWLKRTGYRFDKLEFFEPTESNLRRLHIDIGDDIHTRLDKTLDDVHNLEKQVESLKVEMENMESAHHDAEVQLDECMKIVSSRDTDANDHADTKSQENEACCMRSSEPPSLTDIIRSLRDELECMVEEYKKMHSRVCDCIEEMQSKELEMNNLQNMYESNIIRLNKAGAEIEDLEQTLHHMQTEMHRKDSVDVKNIVSSMLEYVNAMDNIILDCETDVPFKDIAEARRQKLMMDLKNNGLIISAHRRGDEVTEGRVDIQALMTDDPEKDGTVARVDRYGFLFDEDIYAGEAESLSMYKLS